MHKQIDFEKWFSKMAEIELQWMRNIFQVVVFANYLQLVQNMCKMTTV